MTTTALVVIISIRLIVMGLIMVERIVTCEGCPYLREREIGGKVIYGCIRLPYQECQIEQADLERIEGRISDG